MCKQCVPGAPPDFFERLGTRLPLLQQEAKAKSICSGLCGWIKEAVCTLLVSEPDPRMQRSLASRLALYMYQTKAQVYPDKPTDLK